MTGKCRWIIRFYRPTIPVTHYCQVEWLKLLQLTPLYTYLKSAYGSALETKICLEVLCNFTYKTLEWQLPDQQLSGLLVSSNFSKGHSTWPVRI
jgi:hypothetical protein